MTTKPRTWFIDTSSCLLDGALKVISDRILPQVVTGAERLVVAGKVMEELANHARADKGRLSSHAATALRFFDDCRRHAGFRVVGEPGDQFPDALFLTAFSRFRTEFPCVLLTQDVDLMHDVLRQSESRSVTRHVFPQEVWTIDERSGVLRPVAMPEVERRLAARLQRQAAAKSNASSFRPYALTAAVTTGSTLMKVTGPQPVKGSLLTCDDGSRVSLGDQLGRGGEGTAYRTDRPGHVAKIYQPSCLTTERRDKLQRMVEHGLDWDDPRSAGICWPKALLLDANGDFRGYLMPEARGSSLADCVFVGTNLRRQFPDWDRVNLVSLCLAITSKIEFLHTANVIIGDINQNNIFVAGDDEVYFLDADSYQVEMWPCPVGTVHFTPPELQGRRLSELLRTKEHERFAVATLLFMILHAGKPPFAQTQGSDPAQNIRTRCFPYCLGSRPSINVPEGPWRLIWSNLSFRTKQAFFTTFDKSCADKPRTTLEEWLSVLRSYKHHLENHDLGADDVERQLFPTGRKPLSDHAMNRYGQVPSPRIHAAGRPRRAGGNAVNNWR